MIQTERNWKIVCKRSFQRRKAFKPTSFASIGKRAYGNTMAFLRVSDHRLPLSQKLRSNYASLRKYASFLRCPIQSEIVFIDT